MKKRIEITCEVESGQDHEYIIGRVRRALAVGLDSPMSKGIKLDRSIEVEVDNVIDIHHESLKGAIDGFIDKGVDLRGVTVSISLEECARDKEGQGRHPYMAFTQSAYNKSTHPLVWVLRVGIAKKSLYAYAYGDNDESAELLDDLQYLRSLGVFDRENENLPPTEVLETVFPHTTSEYIPLYWKALQYKAENPDAEVYMGDLAPILRGIDPKEIIKFVEI